MSDTSSNQDLDLSLLNEIADGSDEFIIESIDMFLQQTPELLTIINNSLNANDCATAATAAHKLKPTLGFFGMLNTQALIQEVELACKGGLTDLTETTSKFNQAQSTLVNNIALLKKLKAEAQSRI